MKASSESINLRAKPEMVAMVNAAKEWIAKHPGEFPSFSRTKGGLIFNDNSAADEIEQAITKAGEAVDCFVEPNDIWNAVTFALVEQNKSCSLSHQH